MPLWLFLVIIFVIWIAAIWFINASASRCYSRIVANADAYSDNYLRLASLKPKKDAMDYYRMGHIYDFVYKSRPAATKYYNKALRAIDMNNPKPYDTFVLSKIVDRQKINLRMEMDDVRINPDELELPPPLERPPPLKTKGKREKKEIKQLAEWTEDGQNVHETAIYNEFGDRVEELSARVYDLVEFADVVKYMQEYPLPEEEEPNRGPALHVLKHIKTYNPFIYKARMKEVDLVRTVVSDIMQNHPEDRQRVLMENLMLNLKDADNSGSPVCINGRVVRLMNIYSDGENKAFRTQQVIKNEMLEVAGATQTRYLAALDKSLADAYERGDPTPEVDQVKAALMKEITQEIGKVAGADPDNLKTTLAEIRDNCIYT